MTTTPSPSWQARATKDSTAKVTVSYTDVRCADCATYLKPVNPETVGDDGAWEYLQAEAALRVTFSGGYGELVDTLDNDLSAYLCFACAKDLADSKPWVRDLIAQALDCNLGHVCGGTLTWTAASACRQTLDWHGWRPVWYIVKDNQWETPVACYWDEEDARMHTLSDPNLSYAQTIAGNAPAHWPPAT